MSVPRIVFSKGNCRTIVEHCGTLLLLFSCSVVSDSFWPHRLQHNRPPCPSPPPEICPRSCSLHPWCCPAISSSAVLFSRPQSFPASAASLVSRLFPSEVKNPRASPSSSVLPVNIQCWSPLRLTCLVFLLSRRLSAIFSSLLWTMVQRHQFFGVLPSLWSSSHTHTSLLGRP